MIGRSPSVWSLSSDTALSDNRTRHYLQRPVTFRASVRSTDRRCTLTATIDRTLSLSVRSLRDQSLVHTVGPCLFCRAPVAPSDCPHSTGGHSAGGVPNPSHLRSIAEFIHINSNFISFINVPTPPSVHHHMYVLAFSQSFSKGLATQLATPLNPSDDAN